MRTKGRNTGRRSWWDKFQTLTNPGWHYEVKEHMQLFLKHCTKSHEMAFDRTDQHGMLDTSYRDLLDMMSAMLQIILDQFKGFSSFTISQDNVLLKSLVMSVKRSRIVRILHQD